MSQRASQPAARHARTIVVTGSGFTGEEREVIKDWASQLGITYSGDLVARSTTHLVARDLLAVFSTQKYFAALQWGINIVSFRWLYDSLQAGRLLSVGPYKSDPDRAGPADSALLEGVQRRRRAQVQLRPQGPAAQPGRCPLQQLNANSFLADRPAVSCCAKKDGTAKAAGGGKQAAGSDTGTHTTSGNGGGLKRKSTVAVSHKSADGNTGNTAGHDFTFDIPPIGAVTTAAGSPRRLLGTEGGQPGLAQGQGTPAALVPAGAPTPTSLCHYLESGQAPAPSPHAEGRILVATPLAAPVVAVAPAAIEAAQGAATNAAAPCAASPSPSLELGVSQLGGESVISISAVAIQGDNGAHGTAAPVEGRGVHAGQQSAGCFKQPGGGDPGGDCTPTSGISMDETYVTRRSAAVRPTRLDLEAAAGAGASMGGGQLRREGAEEASGAAAACTATPHSCREGQDGEGQAVGAEEEWIDLLTPCSNASQGGVAAGGEAPARQTRRGSSTSSIGGCEEEGNALPGGAALGQEAQAATQAAGGATEVSSPPAAAAASVLYSGFDLPLAAVATATKSRRLVRNDHRGSQGLEQVQEAMPDSAQGGHEDLEDGLEDDVQEQAHAAGAAGGARHGGVGQREQLARGRGEVLPPGGVGQVGPLAAAPRPSLANSSVSVEALRSVWQQRQQEQQQQPGRRLVGRAHGAGPGAGAALVDMSEGCSSSRPAARTLRAVERPPAPAQAMHVKQEPGAEGTVGIAAAPHDGGAPQHAHARPGNHPALQVVKSEPGSGVGAAVAAAAAIRVPSLRRVAAAQATVSLLAEPVPIPPAQRRQGPGRAKARGSQHRQQPEEELSTSGSESDGADSGVGLEGYQTDASSHEDAGEGNAAGSTAQYGSAAGPRRLGAGRALGASGIAAPAPEPAETPQPRRRLRQLSLSQEPPMQQQAQQQQQDAEAELYDTDCGEDGALVTPEPAATSAPAPAAVAGPSGLTQAGRDGGRRLPGRPPLAPPAPAAVTSKALGVQGHEEGLGGMGDGVGGQLPLGPVAGPATINRILSQRTAGLTPLRGVRKLVIEPGACSSDSDDPSERATFSTARAGSSSRLTADAGSDTETAEEEDNGDDDGDRGSDVDFRTGSSRPGAAPTGKPRSRTVTAGARSRGAGKAAVQVTAPAHSSGSALTGSTAAADTVTAGSMGRLQGQVQPLPDDVSISRYLRAAVRMAEAALGLGPGAPLLLSSEGAGGVAVVKALSRPPRTHTVREAHPGVVLKTITFAEQVNVEPLRLLLNCRDRSRRARCPIIAVAHQAAAPGAPGLTAAGAAGGGEAAGSNGSSSSSSGGDLDVFLAEPCVLYKLPDGEWWLEYYRYYSASDVRRMATAMGRALHLPQDFNTRRELLRDTDRRHCRLGAVRGDLGVLRTKKLPPANARPGDKPAFCRYIFDSHTGEVLTDQTGADFIVGA